MRKDVNNKHGCRRVEKFTEIIFHVKNVKKMRIK